MRRAAIILGVCLSAAAPVFAYTAGILTDADKAYIRSIDADPETDAVKQLTDRQALALHQLIGRDMPAAQKKDSVDKFLDNAVAQLLLNMEREARPAAPRSARPKVKRVTTGAKFLTAADKKYLAMIGMNPDGDLIKFLTDPEGKSLHRLIVAKTDAKAKKDKVDKFLDNVMAEMLLDMSSAKPGGS